MPNNVYHYISMLNGFDGTNQKCNHPEVRPSTGTPLCTDFSSNNDYSGCTVLQHFSDNCLACGANNLDYEFNLNEPVKLSCAPVTPTCNTPSEFLKNNVCYDCSDATHGHP